MNNLIKMLILFFVILIVSCAQYTYFFKQTGVEEYYKNQIDSICEIEKIPFISNDKWIYSILIDDLTSEPIYQYIFIKRCNDMEKTYICTQIDSIYKFNIRELHKIKKKNR